MVDVTDTDPWTPGDGSATDKAWLADWRRRVAALYAEVRAMAASDPAIAHAHWQAVREYLYREHPQSPVPIDQRGTFRASHYPYDPGLRWELPMTPAPQTASQAAPDAPTGFSTSATDILAFSRIGRIELPLPGGPRPLSVYWMSGYSGGLFIPFRDATNGHETYPAGRYAIDSAKSADLGGDPSTGRLTIDLNFAYQPSCAFDPRWACPLAPPENRLDVQIRAGERLSSDAD
jgi:uncharacterized protein